MSIRCRIIKLEEARHANGDDGAVRALGWLKDRVEAAGPIMITAEEKIAANKWVGQLWADVMGNANGAPA